MNASMKTDVFPETLYLVPDYWGTGALDVLSEEHLNAAVPDLANEWEKTEEELWDQLEELTLDHVAENGRAFYRYSQPWRFRGGRDARFEVEFDAPFHRLVDYH